MQLLLAKNANPYVKRKMSKQTVFDITRDAYRTTELGILQEWEHDNPEKAAEFKKTAETAGNEPDPIPVKINLAHQTVSSTDRQPSIPSCAAITLSIIPMENIDSYQRTSEKTATANQLETVKKSSLSPQFFKPAPIIEQPFEEAKADANILLDDNTLDKLAKASVRSIIGPLHSLMPSFLDELLHHCDGTECNPSAFYKCFLTTFWLYDAKTDSFDPIVKETALELQKRGFFSHDSDNQYEKETDTQYR